MYRQAFWDLYSQSNESAVQLQCDFYAIASGKSYVILEKENSKEKNFVGIVVVKIYALCYDFPIAKAL